MPVPTERQPRNPYGDDIKAYEQSVYSYPVQTLNSMRMLGQYYDPMRQRALQSVGAGVQSGNLTTMNQLASTGGLSAADRQAILAQGQRQRVNLSQGSQAAYDQMDAQNLYDTQKFNVGLNQSTLDANQRIMNQRAQDMATEAEKKATNIYMEQLKEAFLQRQLETARKIAQQQGV
jgi:hypothetical protein